MNIPDIRVPLKINPCPIDQAIAELRFISAIPEDAIFGLVYSKFKNDFPKYNKLPILEMPPSLREQEDLKFQPLYRLINEGFILQIGPRSVSVLCQKEYQGWSKFKDKVMMVFQGCQELGLFKETIRLGIRYINVFPGENIYNRAKMDINFTDNNIADHQNILRTEFNHENYKIIVHAINCAKLKQDKTGSFLDIDLVNSQDNIIQNLEQIVEEAHGIEKRLFFGLLKEEFLKKFNPQYGGKS